MDEQKLIQEIRSLYDDLKAEEKGSYLPGSGLMHRTTFWC